MIIFSECGNLPYYPQLKAACFFLLYWMPFLILNQIISVFINKYNSLINRTIEQLIITAISTWKCYFQMLYTFWLYHNENLRCKYDLKYFHTTSIPTFCFFFVLLGEEIFNVFFIYIHNSHVSFYKFRQNNNISSVVWQNLTEVY